MRKSTPQSFLKNHQQFRKTPIPKSNPTEYFEEPSCAYILNFPQRTSNNFIKNNPTSNTSKRVHSN